jgi:hypothetical protein
VDKLYQFVTQEQKVSRFYRSLAHYVLLINCKKLFLLAGTESTCTQLQTKISSVWLSVGTYFKISLRNVCGPAQVPVCARNSAQRGTRGLLPPVYIKVGMLPYELYCVGVT